MIVLSMAHHHHLTLQQAYTNIAMPFTVYKCLTIAASLLSPPPQPEEARVGIKKLKMKRDVKQRSVPRDGHRVIY